MKSFFSYLSKGAALWACSFLLSFAALAQDFEGGILLVGSSSQISGDNLSGFNKLGLSGGFFVRVPFSEKWSATADLLFVQKGSRKNADPENGDFNSYILRMNYIEFPLTADYSFRDLKLRLGLYAGYLISYTEENQNGAIVILDQNQEELVFDPFDLGWVIGVDYDFSENAFLSGRFTNSIIPVRKHPSGVTLSQALGTFTEPNAGQYNSAIQLMLGFRL